MFDPINRPDEEAPTPRERRRLIAQKREAELMSCIFGLVGFVAMVPLAFILQHVFGAIRRLF